jgi:23S rRNA pseudouridine1911/1915/1917 synthase
MTITHHVPQNSTLRLDAYCLGIIPHCTSRSQSKKWIKAGNILVNGIAKPPSYFPKQNDILSITSPQTTHRPYVLPIEIHFEDEHCAVVYKPAGLHVSGNYSRTLRRALIHNITPSTEQTRLPQPEPVHRLDRRTSGLVLAAKTSIAAHRLGEAFAERRIQKTYRALVLGRAEDGASHWPINGKEASTKWKVIDVGRSLHTEYNTILEVMPHTGRTHQIRRHLHHAGFPILGDDLYHNGLIRTDKGLFLSAIGLQFSHPITNESINICVDQPHKFLFLQRENQRFIRFHNNKK